MRLRTPTGRYVYVLAWRRHFVLVYRDRYFTREIEDWYDDTDISAAVNWFVERGWRG